MRKLSQRRQWSLGSCFFGWSGILLHLLLFLLTAKCTVGRQFRKLPNNSSQFLGHDSPVRLDIQEKHVVMNNGLVNVTVSIPEGMVTRIQYNGIDNLLDKDNKENNRGYWDVVWKKPEKPGPEKPKSTLDKLDGSNFNVVLEDEDQIELSFTKTYDISFDGTDLPINIDKRFILLRGYTGFYSYAIFERLKGWPDIDVYEGRIVFKLQDKLFRFMAVDDERQRMMPSPKDRATGQILDYPEAVLLTNPANPFLRGEVDDKYQYSSDYKDNRVHGWICFNPPTGFWMITPSNEFKTAGPVKQDLTAHVGPTLLSMFWSTHYAGESLGIKFRDGEPWKKVFGPVFIYLNSVPPSEEPLTLWTDAKEQMLIETERWPYNFPLSEDFPFAHQRGTICGRLLVSDPFISQRLMTGRSAYVGLAPPGDVGSWQRENKGYQFWTEADSEGYFIIKNVRAGNYSLYAWVPGFIGDYKYDAIIVVKPGHRITIGTLIYKPPRSGPTLWEIGIPDRTGKEYFIPDPRPTLMNQLYKEDHAEKYRQYGLWDRYTELYPNKDLVFRVGVSNYRTDWFFAHVNRKIGNKTYIPTIWRILFDLDSVDESGNYTLYLALASANYAELQVRINNPHAEHPYFTTGLIGKDNAIARHGIHGLYWLFRVEILGYKLSEGLNIIYLTQARGSSPWKGLIYDYIRFEGPS